MKDQHLSGSISFLVDELKCVDKGHAEDRVFFVSAKEVSCWISYIRVYYGSRCVCCILEIKQT